MYKKLTEIEKIYAQKFNINTENLSINERFKLTEDAYSWSYDMGDICGFDVLKNKKRFVEWLEKRVV